jgi:preprotein translocase subunit SecB
MQQPLSISPLQILKHEFESIEIVACEHGSEDSPTSLGIQRLFSPHDDDPNNWRLNLTVTFGSDEPGKETPYKGKVSVSGYFLIVGTFSDEKKEELIRVTGASILWGSCREMIANFTARSSRGMIVLPSVSFVEANPKVPQPNKAKASK